MSARGLVTGRRWSNGRPVVKVTIRARIASVVIASAVVLTGCASAVAPVPPCAEEDSAGPCFWDASTRGNGIGTSFTVDADQVVHYATEATR